MEVIETIDFRRAYTFGNPSAYADCFGYWIQSTPSTYNKIYYAISPNRFVMISAETSDVQAAVKIFEKYLWCDQRRWDGSSPRQVLEQLLVGTMVNSCRFSEEHS